MEYRIYYAKQLPTPLSARAFLKDYAFVPGEKHAYIRTVEAEGLGEVYHRMQGCIWSPRGEARPIIEAAGVSHTSMSVGDVAVDEDGQAWVCASVGWEKVASD